MNRTGFVLAFILAVILVPVVGLTKPMKHQLVLQAGEQAALACQGSTLSIQPRSARELEVACAGPGESPDAEPQPQPPLPIKSGQIVVDSQAWWTNPDGGPGDDFGHLHTQVAWPHRTTIRDPLRVNVRSVLHRNPGKFYRLMVQVFRATDDGLVCNDDFAIACLTFKPARTLASCEATGGTLVDRETCFWDDVLTIDPQEIVHSGWQEFRSRGFVREPDGKDMRTSTSLKAFVDNGRAREDHPYTPENVIRTRGWYTGLAYAQATLDGPPTGPVSGVWRPWVEMDRTANGVPVTGHFAALDTDFHHGQRGTVIKEGSGPYRGHLTIDTRSLTNGWHRLLLKADALDTATGSTNSRVLAIWFEVQN